jgi:hypothetical protein
MVTKLKTLLASLMAEIKAVWNRSKMYLLGLVVILATLEWQKIKAALIVAAGAKEIKKDTKVDGQLAAQEQSASQQGDALQKQANALPESEAQVKPDWYKDQK